MSVSWGTVQTAVGFGSAAKGHQHPSAGGFDVDGFAFICPVGDEQDRAVPRCKNGGGDSGISGGNDGAFAVDQREVFRVFLIKNIQRAKII